MGAQSIEKRGKSVNEAIKAALDELECEIDDAIIEIVEEPSKGLLGLIKKPAIVRVSRRD
ncbi:MAG: protein jag, partial [Syntrophomonadaceae bacterium]|nr:protein jag [Syntrophomonadaceae bacterium]